MTSIIEYHRFKQLEEELAGYGFRIARSQWSGYPGPAILPLGDRYPTFSRNTELGVLTNIESVGDFMLALRIYEAHLTSIGITKKEIERKESIYRQKQLLKTIKGKPTNDSDNEDVDDDN